MAKHEVTEANAAILKDGAAFHANGSKAMIAAIATIVIATRDEQISVMSIPAAQRPKGKDIQAAIREAFGGGDKDNARDEYDLCSVGFRVLSKLAKEREADVAEATKHRDPQKLADTMVTLAGRATVAAIKSWLMGEKAEAKAKTVGEQVLAYLDKRGGELTDDELSKVTKWISDENSRRRRVAEELEQREAA